jgi:hypothetical protein
MNIVYLFGALVLLALLVGIGVIFFLSLSTLLAIARAKKSRKLAIWSVVGTGTATVLLVGLLLYGYNLIFGPYDPTTSVELSQAYYAEFSTLPPPGIKVLKSRQVIVGDAGGQWLLLEATPGEIERHVAMGFKKVESPDFDFSREAGGNTPSWWQPPVGQLEFYENLDWSKNGGWHSSRSVMGVDRRTNLIWFSASKHD